MKTLVTSLALTASLVVFGLGQTNLLAQCISQDGSIVTSYKGDWQSFFLESGTYGEWYRAIRSVTAEKNTLVITGHKAQDKNILRADSLVFSADSTLEFTNVDAPFWAIVAQRIEFQGSNVTITRSRNYTIDQRKRGPAGANGGNGHGWSNGRNGSRGRDGQHGRHGAKGWSKALPCLLILAETVHAKQEYRDTIRIELEGITGGRGGDGGNGGNGGNGNNGRSSASTVIECRRDPGNGGDGGDAGNGEAAGDGGDGGVGGDLLFLGDEEAGKTIMTFQIRNGGGTGGEPGNPGLPGRPGRGGRRGSREGWCQSVKRNGRDGISGYPGPSGKRGAPGQKGGEQVVVIDDMPLLSDSNP